MNQRFALFALLTLIAAAGCGRSVDLDPAKKPSAGAPAVRKGPGDPKVGEAPANGGVHQDANIKELREAAEKLEKAAQEFNQIGSAYSDNMMFAALAWQKAGDKLRALAAAKSAIKAGPGDRSPLDTGIWHTNIGDALAYADEIPLAVEQYQLAVKSDPNTVNAARAQKKLDEAKAKLGKPK